MIKKVALNCLLILMVVGFLIYRDGLSDVRPKNVLFALLLLPVFGFAIWLRWDWAPQRRREKLAMKKSQSITSTDKRETP